MSSAQNAKQRAIAAVSKEKVVSLHKVRSSWVLQLDNAILRSLVGNNAAHIRPAQAQIDALNLACMQPISHSEFQERLKDAGIFLNTSQVKWANAENRQIHYRNQIENDVLRELAKGFRIQVGKWNKSAKKQIDSLNDMMRRPIDPEILDMHLVSIGIAASNEQLKAIIAESAARIEASPYLAARNDCQALQREIAALNTKSIKKQFSSYFSLIINESALSAYSIEELKTEIRSVIDLNGTMAPVENPYMASVKSIREQAERLQARRDALAKQVQTTGRDALLKEIYKTVGSLEGKTYQSLMRQQSTLERWANASAMTDMLHREVKALSPKRVLRNDQAEKLFEKVHKNSARAAFDPLFPKLCQEAAELKSTLEKYRGQMNGLSTKGFDSSAVSQAIQDAKTKQELEAVKAQLDEFSEFAALASDRKALSVAYNTVSGQFMSLVALHKIIYGEDVKLLPKYKNALNDVALSSTLAATSDLSENLSVSDARVREHNPGLDLVHLDLLKRYESLQKTIREKMPTLPEVLITAPEEAVAQVSVESPLIANTTPDIPDVVPPKEHELGLGYMWDYAKNNPGKAVAGAVIGGALVAATFPYAFGVLAGFKIASVTTAALGVKFGVGAAAGGAVTTAVGSKKSSWFGFFRAREVEDATPSADSTNTNSPVNS